MLYLNKLCRKPITTANYGAVYLRQLRKHFAKRNANAAVFSPYWMATYYFSFYTIEKKKNSIYTAYGSLANAMLFLYKASWKRKRKDLVG